MKDSKDDLIVGIDLGTTYSLVAVLRGERPELIPNALGEYLTPSVVSVDEGGSLLVGAAAKSRVLTHPSRTARMFKRDMGTDRLVSLEGHSPLRPEQLSALVLMSLKQDAEAFLGVPVNRAVITVPAYFGDLQRQSTKDAANIAGLTVERIINEPTAAALAYGLANKEAALRAAVLDLGGGTFDVTILEINDGVIEIRSSAGDARLGGEDYSDVIAEHLARRIAERHGVVQERALSSHRRIREHADLAKRAFSKADRATIVIADLELGDRTVDVSFDLSAEEVVSAVAQLNDRIRQPIQRALRDADMLPTAIDEVLLVGGATRMPWIGELAKEMFRREPLRSLPPDEAIALGASVQAGLHSSAKAVEDIVVTDVAPFSLGIESSAQHRSTFVNGLFSPILERGTVIPASRQQSFFTLEDNQTHIDIKVYQGEHSLTKDNTYLGSVKASGIPRAPKGKGQVEVRFTYNLDGILDVDVTVVGTDKSYQLVIERNPGQLSRAQVEAARKQMAKLKFHPRDALPNRTAMARAEAMYVELRGPERDELGEQIKALRLALESQDQNEINNARFALLKTIEYLQS